MSDVFSKVNSLCSGCSACSEVCPTKCIKIKSNDEGFYTAFYDEKKCIMCNRCKTVCPMINSLTNSPQHTYAFVTNDNDIYYRSSSGGVFSIIANDILEQDGYICACGYDSNLVAKHIIVNTFDDLDNLRRSKYVQSYIDFVFPQIKELLINKKNVLFAGTPCQVSGLKNYLNMDYHNLLTIDIVCHGTPSPSMFSSNIKFIEQKEKHKLVRYEFRLKNRNSKSGSGYVCTYFFDNGEEKITPFSSDPFFCEFYNNDSLNECCYECPYAKSERAGDITIGDYDWIKNTTSDFDKYNDVSCILINTDKGKEYFNLLNSKGILVKSNISDVKLKNITLEHPTDRPQYRNYIFSDINKFGYKKWASKFYFSKRYLRHNSIIKKFVTVLKKCK